LHSGQKKLLELVKVGRAVHEHRKRAAVEGLDCTVVGEGLRHEATKGFADLGELGLPLLNRPLKELNHLRPERRRLRRDELLDPREPLQIGFQTSGGK